VGGGIFPHVGQYITGDCRDLQLTCNQYNSIGSNYFDWYIDINSFLASQPNSSLDAGNQFSYTTSGDCGGSGIPFNCINNQGQIFIYRHLSSYLISGNCHYGINPSPTSITNDCINTSLCVIYPDYNEIPGTEGQSLIEEGTSNKNNPLSNALQYIYSKDYENADLSISAIEDENEKLLTNTILNIFESNRDYSQMNSAEENTLSKLAKEYNTAGYISQHILNTFKGHTFPHTPLHFPKLEDNENSNLISDDNSLNLEEGQEVIDMNIYPNPTSDDFSIEVFSSKSISEFQLTIIDINGKVVFSNNYDRDTKLINLKKSDLGSAGTYQCLLTIGYCSPC
jgi:hypothetical protein